MRTLEDLGGITLGARHYVAAEDVAPLIVERDGRIAALTKDIAALTPVPGPEPHKDDCPGTRIWVRIIDGDRCSWCGRRAFGPDSKDARIAEREAQVATLDKERNEARDIAQNVRDEATVMRKNANDLNALSLRLAAQVATVKKALDEMVPLARYAVRRLNDHDLGADRVTALANALAKLDAPSASSPTSAPGGFHPPNVVCARCCHDEVQHVANPEHDPPACHGGLMKNAAEYSCDCPGFVPVTFTAKELAAIAADDESPLPFDEEDAQLAGAVAPVPAFSVSAPTESREAFARRVVEACAHHLEPDFDVSPHELRTNADRIVASVCGGKEAP